MGAKIFISWSGELSKSLGEAIRKWIPKVLQSVKPYFTPDDIEKGSRWAKEISHELESSQLGIICLTSDNQHNPWILFEAGALSKNLEESKICPILFNMDTTELTGPLAAFQATKFSKDDVKKLLVSINNSCSETKLDEKSLEETFEMWWPQLEKSITEILDNEKNASKPKKRSEREIMEEILELTRSNAKTILSEQNNISKITIEELVYRFRQLREKVYREANFDVDLALLDNTISRLCKEGNFEEILSYRRGYNNRLNMIGYSDAHRAKNSSSETGNIYGKNRVGRETVIKRSE